MWPFNKKSKAEKFLEAQDEVISIVSSQWRSFLETMPFKEDVSLEDKITAFSFPAMEGIKTNVRAMSDAPDGLLLMTIGYAIVDSRTHSQAEVEGAMGAPLPLRSSK